MDLRHSSDSNLRIVRRRNRVPLSCAPCRHRKLKCDRTSPCQNCVRRAEAASCVYAASAGKTKSIQTRPGTVANSPDEMQQRIDRLESLVLSLMANENSSSGSSSTVERLSSRKLATNGNGTILAGKTDEIHMPDEESAEGSGSDSDDTDEVIQNFGIMKVDNQDKKTHYFGEGHWATILHDIAEVRNYFQTQNTHIKECMGQIEQTTKSLNIDPGPSLFLGTSQPPPRSEILSKLPDKKRTDVLINHFLNSHDPAIHIFHEPVFLRQYQAHWADPSQTSVVWLGMLFAILRISLLSYVLDGNEPAEFAGESLALSHTCRSAVAECLTLADCNKHQCLIETTIFHLHAEYSSKRDSDASIWVLVAMILRLAMCMGYHRDSKVFPNLTPFEGEMRRRVWAFLRQADILFSFQMSLPGMIRIGDSDTELPRNIHDEDFDESTTTLPPARPASEKTSISYLITKTRLAFGFCRVVRAGVVRAVNDAKIAELAEDTHEIDKGLREIYESVPEHFKPRPVEEQNSVTAQDRLMQNRLVAMYHKSQCVLQQRFLQCGHRAKKYEYNRQTCLRSAMALMEFQSILHHETQDGGRLAHQKSWFSSLTTHDFLLAATIIARGLYQQQQGSRSSPSNTMMDFRSESGDEHAEAANGAKGTTSPQEECCPSPKELLTALANSRDIWAAHRNESTDAFKAFELLNVSYSQLSRGCHQQRQDTSGGFGHDFSGTAGPNDSQAKENQNAAISLGLLSDGDKNYGRNSVADLSNATTEVARSTVDPPPNNESFSQPYATLMQHANGLMFQDPSVITDADPLLDIFEAGGMDNMAGVMNLDWSSLNPYTLSTSFGLDPASALWPSFSPSAATYAADAPVNGSETNHELLPSGLSSPEYYPVAEQSVYNRVPSQQPDDSMTANGYVHPISSYHSTQTVNAGPNGANKPNQTVGGATRTQPDSANVASWSWLSAQGNGQLR